MEDIQQEKREISQTVGKTYKQLVNQSIQGVYEKGIATKILQTYLKAWREAWLLMLACGEDKELYDICNRVFGELKDDIADADTGAHASQLAYAPLRDERFGRSLWKNSYSGLIELLFDMLEQVGNMDRLPENVDAGWMTKLFNNALNYCDVYNAGMRRMFPDQHGTFGTVTALMRDAVQAQELKQIAWCFREQQADCDVQSEMLDRRIVLDARWGFREMRDGEVASRISRAIQRIMAEGNLNDAPELVQEACTGLLAWLQEHSEETKRYFPDFSTEEQQARLMTAKAVVGLQKRSRVFDRLMELTGVGDPEKLMEYVQGMVETPPYSQYDTYDYESGVFFGEEFGELSQEERRDRPDTADYHQEGWDIRVRYWNGKEDPCDREVLIEVKTHTTTSMKRGILPLSDSQMRLALSEGVNFVVYMVDYDLPGNVGVGVTELSDIGRQIAEGKIKCAQDKYLLRVA